MLPGWFVKPLDMIALLYCLHVPDLSLCKNTRNTGTD
ncbi:hypothetical protein SEVIR_7G196050v4 [Setaria viridis]